MARYLDRLRISRRRLLQGTAAGAGLALVGCGGEGEPTGTPEVVFNTPTSTPPQPTPTDPPEATATVAATPRPSAEPGLLRGTGFVRSGGESFDPHKTQFAPVTALHSLVFSKVLQYENQLEGTIGPDLAEGLPEQPDETTYVFKLRPGARYQDRPPLGGAPVRAEDVKFSIERQLGEDKAFRRKSQWVNVESVEASDDLTFTVKTRGPLAPLLHYFADVNAFVVPPALLDAGLDGPQGMVGSGPFMFESWTEGERMRVVRNPTWFGGPERPYLNAIEIVEAADTVAQEAALRAREVDFSAFWRPMYRTLKTDVPGLQGIETGQLAFTGMRFFTGKPPFNDDRLRRALSIALDRQALIEELAFSGAEMSSWISWPLTPWTLPKEELAGTPGYRYDPANREADLAMANQLFNEAGGAGLGALRLVVPDVNEEAFSQGSIVQRQLTGAIPSLVVDLDVRSYAAIAEGLISGDVQWVVASDSGWLDPDDWLVPFFHSQGNRNSFGFADEEFDKLLEGQRGALDNEERRALVTDIQRRLLELAVGVNIFSNTEYTLAWSYARDLRIDGQAGYQFLWADARLDEGDPNYAGRSA